MKISPLIALTLICFALSPNARAVVPPPDGAYPNFTTAEGDNSLKALTTGVGNTGGGTFSLFSLSTGNSNTAVGAGSLDLNTADQNTATGSCPGANMFDPNVSITALIGNVSATELLR